MSGHDTRPAGRPLNGIDQAIQNNEAELRWLDARAARIAMKVTCAPSRPWRERWLAALGVAAQRIDNAQYLLNGLKAIRNRPELVERRHRQLKLTPRVADRRRSA